MTSLKESLARSLWLVENEHDSLRRLLVGARVRGARGGNVRSFKVTAVQFNADGRPYVVGGREDGSHTWTLFADEITITRAAPDGGEFAQFFMRAKP